MPRFEYKVVPAPARGLKAKGVKRPEERFALALSTLMNELGAEGWDYVRADILPSEERAGLASKQTVYHSLLVFRRQSPEEAETPAAPALAAPVVSEDHHPDPVPEPPLEDLSAPDETEAVVAMDPEDQPQDRPTASA